MPIFFESTPLPIPLIALPQVTQQTDSHCGPAVIQSLLAFLNRQVTQDQVVIAARAKMRIEAHGTRPDQLDRAVAKLAPDLKLWYKQNTTIDDLEYLVQVRRWPVAVDWQGLFYDTEEEQIASDPKGDHGHYSIVVGLNEAADEITISDPYAEFSYAPRVFSLAWFEARWWDSDNYKDKKTGKKKKVRTRRLSFLVTPEDESFPINIGMKTMAEKSPFK